jgi:methyl-accepting chemotaxis protein
MKLDPRASFTGKVVVGFAVVVLVGAGVGAFLLTDVQQRVQTEQRQTLVAEADLQEDTVSSVVLDLETRTATVTTSVESIRDQASIPQVARQEIRETFRRQASERNATSALHLVDGETKDVVVSSDPDAEGKSVSTLGYAPPVGLTAGEPEIRLSTSYGKSWVVYTKTESGDLVLHETPLSYFTTELEGVLDESRTRIVNSQGVVVYDSVSTARVGTQHIAQPGVDSRAVAAGFDTPGTAAAVTLNASNSPSGDRVVSAYNRVEGAQWTVVSYASPSGLFAVVDAVWRDMLIVLGVIGALLAGYGVVVARPAANRLAELGETVSRLEDGELDVAVERQRSDEIGDLAAGLDEMRVDLRAEIADARDARESAESARQRAEAAREEAESARADAEALSDHLTTKAETYADALERLADGDFTTRVDPESRHEGMQSMGETLNDVVGELERTLAAVQQFSTEVAASMEGLSDSATQIETASGEVGETVRVIADGAEEQRERLDTVTNEVNSLSATVEEVASTSSEVAARAEQTAERSEAGREAAEEAAVALDEIQAETESAVTEVNELVGQMEAIGEFTEVIATVADQTNLLALNANIEAARADVDGASFAVVADEIKQLAERAGARADDIETRIEAVNEQTATTAATMREAADRLDESGETVETAIDALVEVDDLVAETTAGVREINRAADDQAAAAEEVAAMVDEVAEIAERTATDADEVTTAADRQTSATAAVSETADALADDATTLSETVAQFTVDPDEESETTAVDDPESGLGVVDDAEGEPTADDEESEVRESADNEPPAVTITDGSGSPGPEV